MICFCKSIKCAETGVEKVFMMCENKTAILKYRHIISVITADYFAYGRRIIRSVQPDYTLLLRFDNGECRRLDMNPVIQAVCSST